MLENLIRYVLGSCKIKIICTSPEEVINALIINDFKIRNVKKTTCNEVLFECYLNTYKKIKNHPFFRNFDLIIISKKGFPNIFSKYKKRYGLFIGALLFAGLLYVSSLFIWDIQVSGNDSISTEKILNELSYQGFVSGKMKRSFTLKNIENGFLSRNDNISWISINLKGTVAFVEVRENMREIKKLDTSKPSNIYASRDAVIESITTYMGYKTVEVGDTVSAGDMIVTGEYTDKFGKSYKLHSYAKVMAYTTHSYTVKVPFKTVEQQFTGKKKKYFSLKLTRFTIPLYFKEKISYNNYSKNKSIKNFKLSSSFVLPFSLQTTTYLQTNDVVYNKSKDAALIDAYEKLDDMKNNLVGITVLDKEYDIVEDSDGVTVKAYFKCYEDIGIEKEIC